MKKILFLFVALLVISGMAGAQVLDGTDLDPKLDEVNEFDSFNAVPTLSTEARYSAGIFGSYVDDFIDVNFFDPNAGTFVFLGGYPAAGNVATTDQLTPANYALSAGFAQTFDFGYIGGYYGGSLVDSAGTKDNADRANASSETEWRNNLAVLVALNALPGAFRLDFAQATDAAGTSVDGDNTSFTRTSAPSLALTYGGLDLAGFNPFVTIGYRFADSTVTGVFDAENKYYQRTETSNSLFGIQAGTYYDIDEFQWLSGALVFALNGATSSSGDNYAGLPDYDAANPDTFDTSSGGSWSIGLRAVYANTMEFGQVSVGFKPNLRLGYQMGSTSAKDAKGSYETAAQDFFQIDTGVDVGLKFQLNEQFAFYTGASLQIIDFRTMYYSGGNDYSDITDVDDPNYGRGDLSNSSSFYDIDGLRWNTTAWSSHNSGNLGFGMTFSPMENLVIGAGLNGVLDKLFYIDLDGMRVGTGTLFDADAGANNLLREALNIFSGIYFDLTVSYKL